VEHREIGGTGIRASRVGLGTWAIGGWMWGGMRAAVPAAAQIGTLVNAHSNPDHTNGNQLVVGAQIISSTACLEEMKEQSSAPRYPMAGEAGAFPQEVLGSRLPLRLPNGESRRYLEDGDEITFKARARREG